MFDRWHSVVSLSHLQLSFVYILFELESPCKEKRERSKEWGKRLWDK